MEGNKSSHSYKLLRLTQVDVLIEMHKKEEITQHRQTTMFFARKSDNKQRAQRTAV